MYNDNMQDRIRHGQVFNNVLDIWVHGKSLNPLDTENKRKFMDDVYYMYDLKKESEIECMGLPEETINMEPAKEVTQPVQPTVKAELRKLVI